MVNHVAEAMHVDVCSIYLLDERNQRYVLMASKGLNPDSVGNVSLHVGEGLVGWSDNAKKSSTLTMLQT
jgi:phosphotransferase system enzyme I (PtsP)